MKQWLLNSNYPIKMFNGALQGPAQKTKGHEDVIIIILMMDCVKCKTCQKLKLSIK